jgi:thiamine-monophosphate kinase
MIPRTSNDLLTPMLEKAGDRSLADVGEKTLLIDYLLPMCRSVCGDHGLGDDAGILTVPVGAVVAITTDRVPSDLLARKMKLMSPFDFGAYLVRVNVSDLAATGADPLGMVVTSAFKPTERVAYVLEVMWGIYVESARFGCPVVGGDTKDAFEESVSATAVGVAPEGRSVGRGPVKPGMHVYLSGPVGHAGVALRWFMRDESQRRVMAGVAKASTIDHELKEYIVRPKPRVDLAKALRDSGCPCAMDISDGLGQSLLEIAKANSVDIELNYDQLSFHPSAIQVAKILGLNMRTVLGGIGLDLELVAIGDALARPDGFHVVGRVVAGDGNIKFSDGETMSIKGYEHFIQGPDEFLK